MDTTSTYLNIPSELLQVTNATTNSCLNATEAAKTSKYVVGCSLETCGQCIASYWIYISFSLTMLLLGTAGNALIVMVMRQLRRSEFGTYMSVIAVTDILVLWVTLPRHFIRWMWLVDIREQSQWICRAIRCAQFSLMHVSAWLLTIVTVERWLSLYFPLHFHNYKRRFRKNRRAAITTVAIALFHVVWNLHIFWTLGEQRESGCNVRACGYTTPAFAYYWQRVHHWVDLVKLSVLPFAIMLTINLALLIRLRQRDCEKSKKRRPSNLTSGKRNSSRRRRRRSPSGAIAVLASSAAAGLVSRKCSEKPDRKTAMLLSVSFFYVAMTLPTFISTALGHAKIYVPLIDSISTMLFYANNAFNFVLFCLSNKAFRRHFAHTLRSSAKILACRVVQRERVEPGDLNSSTFAAGIRSITTIGPPILTTAQQSMPSTV